MLDDIALIILDVLITATLGGILTRAIFIRKAASPRNGLYLGTLYGLLVSLLSLEWTGNLDDNALLLAVVAGGCLLAGIVNNVRTGFTLNPEVGIGAVLGLFGLLIPLGLGADGFPIDNSIALIGGGLLALLGLWGGVLIGVRQQQPDEHAVIPFYRDLQVLRVLVQVWFGVLFIGTLIFLGVSLTENLSESRVALDFNVYSRRFGATISEGIPFNNEWSWVANPPALLEGLVGVVEPYLRPSTMTRVIISGFYNTLRVVFLSIFASTFIGVLVGIGLLSRNYLIRQVSTIYTEIFRNTPLLVQLIFMYQLLLLLPAETEGRNSTAIVSPDNFLFFRLYEKLYVLSASGLRFVDIIPSETFGTFFIGLIAALVAGFFMRRWRLAVQESTGTPARTWLYTLPTVLGIMAAGWLLAGGWPLNGGPFNVDYPRFTRQGVRFVYDGGYQLTLAFTALFFALTLYTAAFIADIVRAGIQSVPYGQIEAARSMGLRQGQVLSLVVLPQALRLIIPPLGNQYVNLGKNSSLGIAVAFVDVYSVVQLANNESGQAVPFFFGMMLIYLSLSLTLSLLTNLFNLTTRVRTR